MAAFPVPPGIDPHTPVLVGVGQHVQRTDEGAPELSPVQMMTESLRTALADTGADSPGSLGASIAWLAAVPALTWRYADAARPVADALGARSATTGSAPRRSTAASSSGAIR